MYVYILNNDSASAYEHYSSYKKEGHDELGEKINKNEVNCRNGFRYIRRETVGFQICRIV